MSPPHLPVEDFLDYLRAFNEADYDKQHSFYSEDVTMVLPDPEIPKIMGSQGIKTHYKPIHADAKETVIPIIVLCDRGRVFLQMEAYFLYKNEVQKAVHDYHVHPGDVIRISCCAIYDLDSSSKIKTITCHLFQQELLGQVNLQAAIRESELKADADLRLYNY
ncbi:hypothetical protein B0J13DRAFT_560380 [Dactylonectria estremocensis]|uniref:SnoaL-like domain-containing protein n=1 Tax=Dactylonectria estremocensis TaxID=1079267 RepID=A0A9P9J0G5_9HYPO|nr:hypothetical protein B0J13DRAFT_560380 [Dactylonectria estremocensis]